MTLDDFETFTAALDLCGVSWSEALKRSTRLSGVVVLRHRGLAHLYLGIKDRRPRLVRFSASDAIARPGVAARDVTGSGKSGVIAAGQAFLGARKGWGIRR